MPAVHELAAKQTVGARLPFSTTYATPPQPPISAHSVPKSGTGQHTTEIVLSVRLLVSVPVLLNDCWRMHVCLVAKKKMDNRRW